MIRRNWRSASSIPVALQRKRMSHKDQLGSTRAITDSTGAVSASYAFDPYGNPTAKTGSLTNPFGYAGQYTDPESDMQYLRARYYDPATLNFITRDPLASSTRAPYDYAADSPTNNIDPTGLGCSATTQAGGRGAGGVTTAPAEAPGLPADMFATGGAAGGQSATGQSPTTPDSVSASQPEKRRLAKSRGGVPRSASPDAQRHSAKGRWWEYTDSEGNRKIVVEHPDGTVHVGRIKDGSSHREGGLPKFYDEGGGHVE